MTASTLEAMLVEITNTPRDYAWGSSTLIAELQGRTGSGPEAEVWFGDHPSSPSQLPDGRTLADVESAPLPYLLKLLAAASALSIQAHPSKAQAEEGFAREEAAGVARDAPERNYTDDNHKPEVIVAVSDTFEALAGLRDLDETRALVARLGEAGTALGRRLEHGYADTIGWLLSGEAQHVVDDVVAAASASRDPDLEAVRRLAKQFPSDPGVVVGMLMNHVVLCRGEAIYVRAGVLHAYLAGLGVEVMAASDNVLRGGLTPKHVDVAELLHVLDAAPEAPPLLRPVPVAERVELFAPGIPDFALLRVRASAEATEVALTGRAIALVIEGEATLRSASDAVSLTPGRAAYVSAGPVTVAGEGLVYIAEPGR